MHDLILPDPIMADPVVRHPVTRGPAQTMALAAALMFVPSSIMSGVKKCPHRPLLLLRVNKSNSD